MLAFHPWCLLVGSHQGGEDARVKSLAEKIAAGPVSHFPVAIELTLATGLCTRQALAPQPCCINVR